MANRIRSGIKRRRQNEKRSVRNLRVRSRLKTLSKNAHTAIESRDLDKSQAALKRVISAFDRAASKRIIHKRTASRKISRFSKRVDDLSRELTQSPA